MMGYEMRKSTLREGYSSYWWKDESHLRWLGHVQRRAINARVRKSEWDQVERTIKNRGWPSITLVEVIKDDLSIKEVTENMTSNIIELKKRKHVANPN